MTPPLPDAAHPGAGEAEAASEVALLGAATAAVHAGDLRAAAGLLTRLGMRRGARGDWAQAAASYGQALSLGAGPAARHGRAAALFRLGRIEEARAERDRAFAEGGRVFIEAAADPAALRLLLPALPEDGNIPHAHLFPPGAWTLIWWFFPGAAAPALPDHDAVFLAAADPDMAATADWTGIDAWAAASRRPVLNPPARIAATRRDRIAATLSGIPGLIVPDVARLTDGASWRGTGIAPPLLVRPAGAHGGTGLRRAGTDAEADAPADGASVRYLHAFADTRGADGLYRKYRAIFVGGRAYPYHLAISPDWLVHYFRAEMDRHKARQAEEAAFLAEPAAAIGRSAWTAIETAGARLGLDYAGIDFALAPDRSAVIVWEANATMLVHPEDQAGPLAYKNPAVRRIQAAFAAMVAGKTQGQAEPA